MVTMDAASVATIITQVATTIHHIITRSNSPSDPHLLTITDDVTARTNRLYNIHCVRKKCHFISYYDSHVSWLIFFINFAQLETGINTL